MGPHLINTSPSTVLPWGTRSNYTIVLLAPESRIISLTDVHSMHPSRLTSGDHVGKELWWRALWDQPRVKPTRRQKGRITRMHGGKEPRVTPPVPQVSQWTREELQRWQEDESLEQVRMEVRAPSFLLGSGFYMDKGLIYRRWVPPGHVGEDRAVEQLVLPSQEKLRLAHSSSSSSSSSCLAAV